MRILCSAFRTTMANYLIAANVAATILMLVAVNAVRYGSASGDVSQDRRYRQFVTRAEFERNDGRKVLKRLGTEEEEKEAVGDTLKRSGVGQQERKLSWNGGKHSSQKKRRLPCDNWTAGLIRYKLRGTGGDAMCFQPELNNFGPDGFIDECDPLDRSKINYGCPAELTCAKDILNCRCCKPVEDLDKLPIPPGILTLLYRNTLGRIPGLRKSSSSNQKGRRTSSPTSSRQTGGYSSSRRTSSGHSSTSS